MAALVQTGTAWIAKYVSFSLTKVVNSRGKAVDNDESPHFQPHDSYSQTLSRSSASADDTQSSTQVNLTKKPFYIEDGNIHIRCYDVAFGAAVQLCRFTRTEPTTRVVLSDSVSTIEAVISKEACDRHFENRGSHVSNGTTGGVAYLKSFEIVVSTHQSASSCLSLFVTDLNYRGSSDSPIFGKPKAVQSDPRVRSHLEQLVGQESDLESASNESEPEELVEPVAKNSRKRSRQRKKDVRPRKPSSNPSMDRHRLTKEFENYPGDHRAAFDSNKLGSMPTNMFMGHVNGLEPVVPQGRRYMDLKAVSDQSGKAKKLLDLIRSDFKHDPTSMHLEPVVEASPTESTPKSLPRTQAIPAENPLTRTEFAGETHVDQAEEGEQISVAPISRQRPANLTALRTTEPTLKKLHQDTMRLEQQDTPSLQTPKSNPEMTLKSSATPSELQVDSYMHRGNFAFAKYITSSHKFSKAQNVTLKQADSLAHPDPGAKYSTYSVPPEVLKDLSIVVEERAAAAASAEKSLADRPADSSTPSQQQMVATSMVHTPQEQSDVESEDEPHIPWSSSPVREASPKVELLPPDSSAPSSKQDREPKTSPRSSRSPKYLKPRPNPTTTPNRSDRNQPGASLPSSPPHFGPENHRLSNAEYVDLMEEDDLAIEAPHALGDLPRSEEMSKGSQPGSYNVDDEPKTTNSGCTRQRFLDVANIPHTPIRSTINNRKPDLKTSPMESTTLVPGTFMGVMLPKVTNRIAVDGALDSDPPDMSDKIQQQFEEDQTRASARIGKGGRSIGVYKSTVETNHGQSEKGSEAAKSQRLSQSNESVKRKLVLSPKSTNLKMKRPKTDLMTQVDYEVEDPTITARKNRREHFDQTSTIQKLGKRDTTSAAQLDHIYQSSTRDTTMSNVNDTVVPTIERSPDTMKVAESESPSKEPTASKHDMQQESFSDVFENFRHSYPKYRGGLIDFVEFCFWLNREITGFRRHYPIFVWDDMIVRFKDEYQKYREERKSNELHQLDFAEFYANEISQPIYCKGVVNKSTLDVIMGIHNGSRWDSAKQGYLLSPRSEARRDLEFYEQYMKRVHRETPQRSQQNDRVESISSSMMSRTGSNQSAIAFGTSQNGQHRDLLRDAISMSPLNVTRDEAYKGNMAVEKQRTLSNQYDMESVSLGQTTRHRSVSFASIAEPDSCRPKRLSMYQQNEKFDTPGHRNTPPLSPVLVPSELSSPDSTLDVADLDLGQMTFNQYHPTPQWSLSSVARSNETELSPSEFEGQEKSVNKRDRMKTPHSQKTDAQLVEKREWFNETDNAFATFAKGYGALKSVNGILGDPVDEDAEGMVLKHKEAPRGLKVLEWKI